MGIRLRTVPITHFQNRSAGAATAAVERSSDSPTFCCGYTRANGLALSWPAGIRSMSRPTVIVLSLLTRVAARSTLRDQLELLPEFVVACGFASAKSLGYEADDFFGRRGCQRGAARRDGYRGHG
jgi:hypothetical protein